MSQAASSRGSSPGSPTTDRTAARAYRPVFWTPVAVAAIVILSMMLEREAWLYFAVLIGIVASTAVGRTVKMQDGPCDLPLWEFVKGWSVVVALAALSVLHERWEPMVFFAVLGALSSVFFSLGCRWRR